MDQGFSQQAFQNDPQQKAYRDALYQAAMAPPGSDAYMGGAYYKSLMAGVNQNFRQTYQNAGADYARTGAVGAGLMGRNMRAGNEREYQTDLARMQAQGQAQQAWAGEEAQRFDRLLKAAGFNQGVADQQFQRWYMTEALKNGISQQEAAATLQKWQMILGLVGQAGGIAATVATAGGAGPNLMPGRNPIGTPRAGTPY